MNRYIENDTERWQLLESTSLPRKPWLTLRQDNIPLSSGRTIDTFYVQEFPAWVNVLAFTPECEIVLIRQYRHAPGVVSRECLRTIVFDGEIVQSLHAAPVLKYLVESLRKQ
jgi:hypothetical protein